MKRLRALWLWASLPAATPGIRDLIAVLLLAQGVVRLIDGALFALTPTRFAAHPVYGALQIVTGLALLLTRASRHRSRGYGRMAAAWAASLFLTLAVDMLYTNASSSVSGLLFAWVMTIEARYVVTDHH